MKRASWLSRVLCRWFGHGDYWLRFDYSPRQKQELKVNVCGRCYAERVRAPAAVLMVVLMLGAGCATPDGHVAILGHPDAPFLQLPKKEELPEIPMPSVKAWRDSLRSYGPFGYFMFGMCLGVAVGGFAVSGSR